MKSYISESVMDNGKTPSLAEIDRMFMDSGAERIWKNPGDLFAYRLDGRNFRFKSAKEAWDFISLNDLKSTEPKQYDEAVSRNPFVLVLNRGGKYIEVKRRFRTLDDAYDYGNIQMESFFANGKLKADGYCVINWDEYKIEGYEGDFPTSGVFAKDLYANSPTFTTYTIYPNGVIADTQNESKSSGNDMKLRINEWNSADGDYVPVEELGKRDVISEAKRLGATLISSTDSTTAYRLVDEGFQCICRSFDRYGNISAMVAGKHISSRILPNDNEEYVYTNSSGAASTILGRA